MKYPLLSIAEDGSTPSRRFRAFKTRAFSVTLLRCLSWPAYRHGTGKSYGATLRPVFLDFCGSESEHRAFVANLRMGRAAKIGDSSETLELLRSEPYTYAPPQRSAAGIRQIVYYGDLFDLEPKTPSQDTVEVAVMPPASLLNSLTPAEIGACSAALKLTNAAIEAERERIQTKNEKVEHWRRRHDLPSPIELSIDALCYWALAARELAVRLDARTRFPIPQTAEFRAILLQTLLAQSLLALADDNPLRGLIPGWRRDAALKLRRPDAWGTAPVDAGYLAPIALSMSQAKLGELLAELARDYFAS